MIAIEAVKSLVCYEQGDFIQRIMETVKIMQDDDLEVDIQYATMQGVFTALIIGKRRQQEVNEENGHSENANTITGTTKEPKRGRAKKV